VKVTILHQNRTVKKLIDNPLVQLRTNKNIS
jgi:hypothetical protein